MSSIWKDAYKAAVQESDWSKMLERIRFASHAIFERQRVLSEDHGGTPQERQALAEALNSLERLGKDVDAFQERRLPAKA